jgi:galactonate dehydratase
MTAISGIDQALWDITGKFHNVPAYALLGGAQRSSIRGYIWIGGDRSTDLVADAKAAREQGYNAVKMNVCEELAVVDTYATVDRIIRQLGDLRAAVGADLDLAFDFHGRVHAPMARVLVHELEPLRPMFIEDPVAPGQLEALAALSAATSVPLAVGERMHSRAEFKALFEARAAQVINPDPAHIGGITEAIRLGAMAEAYDVALAPHCPLGPIALAACLQVDAICYNAFIQEQSLGIHYNQSNDLLDYMVEASRFKYEDGSIRIPDGPGLGIEIDEDYVRARAAVGHRWRAPVWRHRDGSIAEW